MAKRRSEGTAAEEEPRMVKLWPTISRFLRVFDEIDRKGDRALKWDLIKICGNEAAFNRLITNLLLKNKLLEEAKEGRRTYYSKTGDGQLFHRTLKSDYLLKTWARIGIKKLRRYPFKWGPPGE